MKVDKRNVQLYNVTITADEYPEVFHQPVYQRLNSVVQLLQDNLGITIDQGSIIKSDINRDTAIMKFYVEI